MIDILKAYFATGDLVELTRVMPYRSDGGNKKKKNIPGTFSWCCDLWCLSNLQKKTNKKKNQKICSSDGTWRQS